MRYFIINCVVLCSVIFCQKNPWILTTEEQSSANMQYLISIGPGSGGHSEEEIVSFKYAFLLPKEKNSLHGFSISGYSQNYTNYWNWNTSQSTRYFFGYSYMKAFNKTDFSGPFWGCDIGVTFKLYEEYPLGITLETVEAIFDSDDRSNFGLGTVLSLGYKMEKLFYTSFSIGLECTGSEDFLFFLDNDDDLDLDVDHSFTSFNVGLIF